jgi:hypothetical protein
VVDELFEEAGPEVTHAVQIWFEERFAARKWSAMCEGCEWVGSFQTEQEAEKARDLHLARVEARPSLSSSNS